MASKEALILKLEDVDLLDVVDDTQDIVRIQILLAKAEKFIAILSKYFSKLSRMSLVSSVA